MEKVEQLFDQTSLGDSQLPLLLKVSKLTDIYQFLSSFTLYRFVHIYRNNVKT